MQPLTASMTISRMEQTKDKISAQKRTDLTNLLAKYAFTIKFHPDHSGVADN